MITTTGLSSSDDENLDSDGEDQVNHTARKLSMGQGNVFTPVVSLSDKNFM